MAEIDIDIDGLGELTRNLRELELDLQGRAIARSLSRTMTGARTVTSKLIRTDLNIKAGDVKKLLTVHRASRGDLSATLVVDADAAPLSRFAARQTARGVTVKVKRRGGRKLVRGAFLVTFASGHTGVYYRQRGHRRKLGRERQTVAVVQFVDDPVVLRKIGRAASDRFVRELASNVRFLELQ